MGLLDSAFDDPATMGLLATAAGLLQAGGPSRTPVGFGQAVGGSLLGGMQAMQQGRQAQQENALNQLRMRGLLGDIQDKELARQQALDAQDWYRKYNQGRVAGPQPQASAVPAPMASAAPGGINSPKTGGPDWLQAYQASAPTRMQPAQQQMGADSTEKLFRDRMDMADAMRTSGIPALIQKADDIEKSALQFRPKFATEFRQAMGADGKLHNYQVAEDGTIREVALGVKPSIKFQDLGGKVVAIDENTAQNGQSWTKTMTPGEIANNGIANRRLGLEFGLTPEGAAMDITTAKAIAEGRLPPPSGMALTNPRNQRILSRVMEINPNYDFTDVTAKRKAASDFTSGTLGNQMRSFATAGQHLDQLGELADALNNRDTQLFNKVANAYATQTGQTAPTNFAAAKDVVSKEVMKAIVAGGGGQAEREELSHSLSAAQSPAQLKGVISQYRNLMNAQYENLLAQRRAAGLSDSTLPKYDGGAGSGAGNLPTGWTVTVK